MRLHGLIDFDDLSRARRAASSNGDGVVDLAATERGSRSAARAWDVILSGDGTTNKRRQNSRSSGRDYAATWCQWGIFLAALYEVDPSMHCWAYTDYNDFHSQTHGMFYDGNTPSGDRPKWTTWPQPTIIKVPSN